jgi:hypothetical protein
MPGKHFILRSSWFTPEAWDAHILPRIDSLDGREGGAVCVLIEVSPMAQNYPVLSVAAFDANERKIIRRAIARQREKAKEARC